MAEAVWESKVKDSIKAFIRKNNKSLQSLIDRDAVEADTRTFVMDMLVEGLGYNKFDELTAEYLVKDQFADLGIRVEKKLLAFIEIKRVSTPLREQHLRQVKEYAANEGLEWVILTNGQVWECFHLSNSTPLEVHKLFSVDLLGPDTPAIKAENLALISREYLKRGVLTQIWKTESALQLEVVASAINTPAVLAAVRAEIRKKTKQLVDQKKLKLAIEAVTKISK